MSERKELASGQGGEGFQEIPSLTDIVNQARSRFEGKEFYTYRLEGKRVKSHYNLFIASSDAIDDVVRKGVDPLELGFRMIRETTVGPDELSTWEFQTELDWREFLKDIALDIVHTEVCKDSLNWR